MRRVNNPTFTELCAHLTTRPYHDAISQHERSAMADLLGTIAVARRPARLDTKQSGRRRGTKWTQKAAVSAGVGEQLMASPV